MGLVGCSCGVIFSSKDDAFAYATKATPKWLEYLLAYCGALAVQGPPISQTPRNIVIGMHPDEHFSQYEY